MKFVWWPTPPWANPGRATRRGGAVPTAKGPTGLRVENYAHGSEAALDSWVVLERKEGGAGGAE